MPLVLQSPWKGLPWKLCAELLGCTRISGSFAIPQFFHVQIEMNIKGRKWLIFLTTSFCWWGWKNESLRYELKLKSMEIDDLKKKLAKIFPWSKDLWILALLANLWHEKDCCMHAVAGLIRAFFERDLLKCRLLEISGLCARWVMMLT